MVTLTKIDPKDIPEVSNKFLMRGNQARGDRVDARERLGRNDSKDNRNRGGDRDNGKNT